MVAGRSNSIVDASGVARRQALSGASGPAALVKNARVFGIACFACLGGWVTLLRHEQIQAITELISRSFVYGYNQGVFSGILTMQSFGKRMHLDVYRNDC